MKFWSSDDKVIEAGVNILIMAAIFQVFDAANLIYGGALRGAGDTVWLAGVSTMRAVVLALGGLPLVWFLPQLGSIGPWVAATLSIITLGVANWWRFRSNTWMQIDLFKRRAIGVPMGAGSAVD
jgi:MATE family multidrug resistance protein